MIHERRDYDADIGINDDPRRPPSSSRPEAHYTGQDRETGPRVGRMRDERSLSHIIRDLRDEATLLVKQQVELLKAEMAAKTSTWVRNAVYIAVGGFIAYAGVLFLLLAATFGVMYALMEGGVTQLNALWAAPLIVGFIVALVGYIFVQKGISTLKRATATPTRTARTLREDKQWLQNRAR